MKRVTIPKFIKRLTLAFVFASAAATGSSIAADAPPPTPEQTAQKCCNMSVEKLASFLEKITPESSPGGTFQRDICIEFVHPTNTEYTRMLTHNCRLDIGKKNSFISVNVDENKVGPDYSITPVIGYGFRY